MSEAGQLNEWETHECVTGDSSLAIKTETCNRLSPKSASSGLKEGSAHTPTPTPTHSSKHPGPEQQPQHPRSQSTANFPKDGMQATP